MGPVDCRISQLLAHVHDPASDLGRPDRAELPRPEAGHDVLDVDAGLLDRARSGMVSGQPGRAPLLHGDPGIARGDVRAGHQGGGLSVEPRLGLLAQAEVLGVLLAVVVAVPGPVAAVGPFRNARHELHTSNPTVASCARATGPCTRATRMVPWCRRVIMKGSN